MTKDVVPFQPIPPVTRPAFRPAVLEVHYFDTIAVATSVSTAGTFYDLTLVPQGNTDVTRGGDMVSAVNIEWMAQAFIGSSAGDYTNILRFVIFQWFAETSADPPSLGQLFNTAASACYSPFAHDNDQKLHVLADETFPLSLNGPSIECKRGRIVRMNRDIRYIAAGTNGTNHIYALAVSDSGAVPHPFFNMGVRFNFFDA